MAALLDKDELCVVLREADVELDAGALMALCQRGESFRTELEKARIKLEQATDDELRAATLLIGLGRAPEHLFSDRHPVSDIIGDLNTHGNPTIAQYSFWATVENSRLGLSNVRVRPDEFARLPPNVQGWAFRILTKEGSRVAQYNDLLVEASQSRFTVVREGVAIALRNIYYDSLDVTVADWLLLEPDVIVRDTLLEHMAFHSTSSPVYREEVLRAFRAAGPASILRSRLQAANRDVDIGREMQKIALNTDDPDLFRSIAGPIVNNTQNFHGTVNIGGLSNSGIGNSGQVKIDTATAELEIVSIIRELITDLHREKGNLKLDIATEAAKAPRKINVERVVSWLRSIKDGGEATAAIIAVATRAVDKITPYLEHLV